MPKNKLQAFIFGLIMSYAMAYGMEIYNVAIQAGVSLAPGGLSNMTNLIFLEALKEASYMGLLVTALSNLWGSRLGAAIGLRWCDPGKDSPRYCRIMRQAGTVAVMCPTMSLMACLLFQVLPGNAPLAQLPAIWVGTILKNFPMAFFWNMFATAPFTHLVCGRLFPTQH